MSNAGTNELVIPMLARGSHHPSSGYGCVMNLMCFEQGRYLYGRDQMSASARGWDQPSNFDQELASALIHMNDVLCSNTTLIHTDPTKALSGVVLSCPSCSEALMDMTHAAYKVKEGVKADYVAFAMGMVLSTPHQDHNTRLKIVKSTFMELIAELPQKSERHHSLVMKHDPIEAYQLMTAAA